MAKKMGFGGGTDDVLPVHPRDAVQQEITKDIENYIRPVLREHIKLFLERDFEMYTITSQTIIAMVELLSNFSMSDTNAYLELWPVIGAAVDAKDADEEKDGNLNVVFYTPEEFDKVNTIADLSAYVDEIVTTKGRKAYHMHVRTDADKYIYKQIGDLAHKRLFDKNNLNITDNDIALLVTMYFFMGVVDVMKKKCLETQHGFVYDINDVVEANVVYRKGDPVVRFVPGVCSKLTIKQDRVTEKDY